MRMAKFVETKTGMKLKFVNQEVIAETRDLKPWVESLEKSAGVYESLKDSREATDILDAFNVVSRQERIKQFVGKIVKTIGELFTVGN